MNLFPIIYTSLLIFSIFMVLIILTSFFLYKLKGKNTEVINSDTTFVLRRPSSTATATSKIIYQKSFSNSIVHSAVSNNSLSNHGRKFAIRSHYRDNGAYAEMQRGEQQHINNKITDNRYQVFTSFDRSTMGH